VNKAFGIQFLTFIVAFAVMASGITSASTLSRAFAGDYLSEFVDMPLVLAALIFIVLVALLNMRGISESVKTNVVLTAVEVIGLILIVVIGAVAIGQGDADFGRNFEFKEGEAASLAILGGASLAFYALIGFEDSVNVAEETRDPSRVFPRALFGGIAIAGVIYMLVTLSASAVVPTADLAASDGPLLEVVEQGPLGISTELFSAIALLAVANGALINMIMASRLVYGMSRERVVPGVFGRVLPERRTPWVAIVFTTALAMVLIATGDLSELADTTVQLLLMVFVVVNVSVLVLRRDEPGHDHFRTPVVFPVLGIVVSLVLMADTLTDDAAVFARAGLLLLLGILLWGVNHLFQRRAAA
jgi:amino acid transporter